MATSVHELVDLIQNCLRGVADQDGLRLPPLSAETELFGEGGLLDSAALVMLVSAVEEAIDLKLGAAVSLADERAMSQTRSPFRSIASLAEYARLRIEEALLDG